LRSSPKRPVDSLVAAPPGNCTADTLEAVDVSALVRVAGAEVAARAFGARATASAATTLMQRRGQIRRAIATLEQVSPPGAADTGGNL
jgi:hypothetical protein